MSRKLTTMSWQDVKNEMSIAGSPERIANLGKEIMEICQKIDATNPAEITNLLFALKRVEAEVKIWQRIYQRKTGQKIS